MSSTAASIYVVDDDVSVREAVGSLVRSAGYRAETFGSAQEFLATPRTGAPSCLVLDVQLPGLSGLDLQQELAKVDAQIPIIFLSGHGNIPMTVRAIKAGALEFLTKPIDGEDLLDAVRKGIASYHASQRPSGNLAQHSLEQEEFDEEIRATGDFEGIVGQSPALRHVLDLVETVAPSDSTVLILGETGTGKELIARAIHERSRRKDRTLVKLNCAAIPTGLLESELFGHEKGAFTGAVKQKLGRVEEAHSGTIFLDEIGDMSRPLQAKLLRFLEDGTFTRVGGNDELRVDVRLIAATNRDIIEAIGQNNFREDLFHRLNVVQFRPPPLRERGEDIIVLAENFLNHFNATMNKHIRGVSAPARNKLLSHHWPGNVRELRNVIERAVILETSGEVQPSSLPDFHLEGRLRKSEGITISPNQSLDTLMAEFERQVIISALEQNRFSISKTAEQLKISRHALRYRIQRLNISGDADDETPPPGGKET